MYICEICDKVFENHRRLNGHKRSHSDKPYCSISKLSSDKLIERNKVKWKDPKSREKLSIAMKKAVKDNPNSYSSSNVSGRTKRYGISNGKDELTVTGTWELEVAIWLNELKINWTNILDGIEYEWNGKTRLYFPDFYLTDYDIYLEVKGFERERDHCKWKNIPNLIVLRKKEIDEIVNRIYRGVV